MPEACQPADGVSDEAWPRPGADAAGLPEPLTERVESAGALVDVARLVTGLLRLARPDVGERSERIARLVVLTLRHLDLRQPWEFEVAARLSQVGWLGLPADLVTAVRNGDALEDDDLLMAASHALIARDLLAGATRLQGVSEMIARQSEPASLPGEPPVPIARCNRLDVGGQLLRVCGELERLTSGGGDVASAVARLESQPAEFHAEIVAALQRALGTPENARR